MRRDFFTPTNNRGPCFFNEGALRRIRMPIFLHLRNDSGRVRILYVWLSAKYSYPRRLRVRIDSRLVRHVVTYSNTFSFSYVLILFLCTYGALRRIRIIFLTHVWFTKRCSCVRMASCDVWRVPLVCVWIITTYSYTLLHVRISSLLLPLVYVFAFTRPLPLVCVLSRFFVLSRHRHRRLSFFFFALELAQDFLFYLRCCSPSLLVWSAAAESSGFFHLPVA